MDACPFNIQMQGQTLKDGKNELVDIFRSVGIGVEDLRVTEQRKGRGASEYNEVTITGNAAVVKWWAPTGRDHDKGGTIMIEGTEELYLRLMEKLMWKSREWARTRRKQSIVVTDDKLTTPAQRRKMYLVAVTDAPGEHQRRTKIFNGFTGEQDFEEMKKTGAIGMGFLSLAKASDWQQERALQDERAPYI